MGGFFGSAEPLGPDMKMLTALKSSMSSCGITAPNPAVGCAIYEGEKLLASGATRTYRLEHAERVVLENFSGDASACDLFVTLEPCAHQGHQPPCIDLVNRFKWKNIFIAVRDPNPKVDGEGLKKLYHHQTSVHLGLLKNESIAWNLPFFFQQHFKRPMIVGKWAETKSGWMAGPDGQSKWISNEKSRAYTHWLRQKYDAILVGAGTFLKDQPMLNARLENSRRQPLRVVWDPKGRLEQNHTWLKSREFNSTGQLTLILSSRPLKLGEGSGSGAHFNLSCGDGIEDLGDVLKSEALLSKMEELLGRPWQSIFIEGGAHTLKNIVGVLDLVHAFQGVKEFAPSPYESPLKVFEALPQWTTLVSESLDDGRLLDRLVEAIPTDKFKKIFQAPE